MAKDPETASRRPGTAAGGRRAALLALLGAGLLPLTARMTARRPLAASMRRPLRLLAYGDSLIHGYGLPPEESLPAQLQAALRDAGCDVTVINGGNSGDTSAAGLARLEWTLGEMPDCVLLCLGANDGLRGLPPDQMERNLRAILGRLQELELPLLLAGMFAPRNWGADYAEEFDAVFPVLAEEFDALFYPFLLEGVALEPALNLPDGIHPNAEGVALIVEGLLPLTLALLERTWAQARGEE